MEFNRIPQCKECVPELLDKNREAAKIWLLTESQFIAGGMGEVYGVNQLAVWQAIEKYGVRDSMVRTFEKVLYLHRKVTMEQIKERREQETDGE